MSGKFALVFGNTQYADAALAQLTAPGQDAQDLGRVLKDPALCGFDEVAVFLNEHSTSAIESIDAFFDDRKPDDLLLLYFSGHGIRDELGSLYLAFSNTIRTRLRSTALKAEYIREAMDESRSKRQILILDCCNSGAFPPGTKAELGGSMGMAVALQGYGRYVLTASDATQFAWEGDRLIGETSNSLFTHFLVKGLEGDADRDGDGTISVDDLYDYSFEQISRLTPKQTPTKSASKQEGEIILRQITRLEDIKPLGLPDDLMEALDDSRTFVREGAVQQLAKLLNGKNLGLARSAREALEKLCDLDDSLRVRRAASDVLAPILAAEQAEREKAEQERLAAEQAEAGRQAQLKAQAELAARQKAAEEQRVRQQAEAERLAAVKAQQELAARQKAEQERLARTQAEADRQARQKAEKERLAQQKADARRLAELERQEQVAARKKAQDEQHAREQAMAAQPNLRPRWRTAIWIALGCSIAAVLADVTNPDSPDSFVFFGALAGLLVAGILYREHVLRRWQSILGIGLGWAVGWAVDAAILQANDWWIGSGGSTIERAMAAAISGGIAGLTIALILRWEKVVSRREPMVWITLAWVGAAMIEALAFDGLVQAVWNAGGEFNGWAVPDGITAPLNGAFGALVMIWLLSRESEPLAAPKVRDAQSAPENVQLNLRPRWLSVLWFTLAFATGDILWRVVLPPLVGDPLFGAFAGLVVAYGLYRERTVRKRLSFLWLAIGWAIASTVARVLLLPGEGLNIWHGGINIWLIAAIAGVLWGFALALVLRTEHVLPDQLSLLWIIGAWLVARIILQAIFQAIVTPLADAGFNQAVLNAISVALYATGAGLATLWLIRWTNEKRENGPLAAVEAHAASENIQQNLRPRWLSVLWIALGGAIGGAILISVDKLDYSSLKLALDFGIWGLCIGLAAALVLRLEHTLAYWRSIVGIALGWSVAWMIGAAIAMASWSQLFGILAAFVLNWALGGFAVGVTLYAEHALPSRKDMGWVTLAWAIGGVASALVLYLAITVFTASGVANMLSIVFATSGLVGAAVGSFGMLWWMRKTNGESIGA